MRSKWAVPGDARFSWVATARNSVSLTSVDLPEPDTPVTHVNSPSGNSAVTFFKLLAVAPMTRKIRFGSGRWRMEGISMRRRPLRNIPVIDSGFSATSAAVPCATILPPCAPAPGPRSTT
jgi:hypothetical protein